MINKEHKKTVIGVIATSSPLNKLSSDTIASGYSYLSGKGCEIIEHPQCHLKVDYTAGTINDRVNAIHEFVKNPDVDVIMSFWGGDNTNQILDSLDYELIRSNPKIFIGYSDTSSLLNAITKKTGLITYLGPAIITFTKPNVFEESFLYFEELCAKEGNKKTVKLTPPEYFASDAFYKNNNKARFLQKNPGWIALREGTLIQKKIIAINLIILQSLISTEYEPDLYDSVLFCEIDESVNGPAFDRIFVHLKQTGILDRISGLVFSKTTDESSVSNDFIQKVLLRNISKDIPIIYNFDCGHTDPIITIPIGGFCDIDTAGGVKIALYK